MSYLGVCGDDEDGLHDNWEDAMAYMLMHMEIGHALNPKKQQVGYKYHEFLQRQCVPKGTPVKPLCSTIASIASGNWYKDSGHHYASAIRSHSDYGWELICRGANPKPVQNLVGMYLDNYMVVPHKNPDGSYDTTPLEWWMYRNAGESHPLWNGGKNFYPTDIKTPDLKKIQYPKLPAGATLAVQDLYKQRYNWLKNMPESDSSAWAAEQQAEAHKSFFGKYSEKYRREAAMEAWPIRNEKREWEKADPITPITASYAGILQTINPDGGERQPPTLEAALAELNMDLSIFQRIGRWKGVIKHGRPSDMRVFQHEWTLPISLLPKWIHTVDPAIASWVKSRNN
jgi:hypothetical protein